MGKTTRKAGFGALMVLVLSIASTAPAGAQTVMVWVWNMGSVPNHTLEEAQEIVTQVYAAIGVRVVWKVERLPLTPGLGLGVVLISPEQEQGLLKHAPAATVLGFAPPNTNRTYTLCGRI